jgi:glycosyltransferase involved in cell wall biosynthesis
MLVQHPPQRLRVPRSYLSNTPCRHAPSFTIVTPSFNQAQFIQRTVDSVFNQGYPRLEYIVQDGASTDGTLEVLERYAGLLRYVSESDDGQADAVNRGFAGTTGEIMSYLNSDDVLLPGALAYVANYLAAHPHVDAVYGQRYLIDTDDGVVGRWVTPPHDDVVLRFADYVPQETLFWRRGLWERVGEGMDQEMQVSLDWELLLRFVEAGASIVRLPRFLGAFRVHPEQKTQALTDVMRAEADRLRARAHGRPISEGEVWRAIRPYLLRHLPYHLLYQLDERLPLRAWVPVTLNSTRSRAPQALTRL